MISMLSFAQSNPPQAQRITGMQMSLMFFSPQAFYLISVYFPGGKELGISTFSALSRDSSPIVWWFDL